MFITKVDNLKDEYIGFGFVIQKAFEHMNENSRKLQLTQKH